MSQAQDIIDQYNETDPGKMFDKLWELVFEEQDKGIKRGILDEKVEVTLYHGTRRKETPEQLKETGFCTFNEGEVEKYITEALAQCKTEINAGPRVCKWMDATSDRLKENYSGRDWEFKSKRPNLWASAWPNASCSWAFRNPEIVHDAFYWRTPTPVMDQILTELFGTPKMVKLKLSMTLDDILGNPSNINTERSCFKPEEIQEVKECSKEDVIESYGGKMPKYKFDGGWITKY